MSKDNDVGLPCFTQPFSLRIQYTDLTHKGNIQIECFIYLYPSFADACHCQEKLYEKKNILIIEKCKLLYTLQNKIDQHINKRKTLHLIRFFLKKA